MQLHPNTSSLYILAASHELDLLSPAAARTLLQRGLRLNADSVDLWREYVKMELGFVESIRRRWEVLGISIDASAKGKGKQAEDVMEVDSADNGDTERPTVDTDKDAQAEADMARREILEGAIVKSVIVNAVKGAPGGPRCYLPPSKPHPVLHAVCFFLCPFTLSCTQDAVVHILCICLSGILRACN